MRALSIDTIGGVSRRGRSRPSQWVVSGPWTEGLAVRWSGEAIGPMLRARGAERVIAPRTVKPHRLSPRFCGPLLAVRSRNQPKTNEDDHTTHRVDR